MLIAAKIGSCVLSSMLPEETLQGGLALARWDGKTFNP